MPVYIPGTDDLYESGLDNLIQATLNRNGVIAGCQVVAHAAPDMGVRVGAGTIQGSNARVAVAQTDLVVAANPGVNARVDLVSINFTTGVPTLTAGVAAATPKPPALPATDILAGYVTVPAAAVNIQNANITDRRLFIPSVYEDIVGVRVHNQLLNGDYGRRTSWQTAMIETFADMAGISIVAGGGAVAGNILTASAINSEFASCNQAFSWRDGRVSIPFKATAIGGTWQLYWRISATERIYIQQAAGNVYLSKTIAGVGSNVVGPIANVLTLNNWYWLELEKQGPTVIVRIYNTGGAAAGVAKPVTPMQTLTATVADASVQAGAHVGFYSDLNGAQWGGGATATTGMYVETWLPESWQGTTIHTGTLGGQAIGYDESADAGPQGKQWAMRAYIPATSRGMTLLQDLPDGSVVPSTTYTASIYMKVSGVGGAGTLVAAQPVSNRSDRTNVTVSPRLNDGGAAAWTRRSVSFDSGALARRGQMFVYVNPDGTATGTAFFQLAQYEQGYLAHPWRAAPEDGAAPRVWEGRSAQFGTTTSAVMNEPDSRDLGMNIFLDRDCTVEVTVIETIRNNTLGSVNLVDVIVDGVSGADDGIVRHDTPVANQNIAITGRKKLSLAQGKHRIALTHKTSGGTLAWGDRPSRIIVSAAPGR